jgi:hypothetical protein
MNSDFSTIASKRWSPKLLKLFNLRPGDEQRTLLMFVVYTLMSMGILWLEVSSAALFLAEYGANKLPLIYIFSAGVGFSLNTFYTSLQRILPLRRVIVLIALVMTLPVLLFRLGLGVVVWAPLTIFAMRLWMEAITNLNELNVAVTANQLFNIREIKRTFPLISSGNLVADAISGFALYFLLGPLELENILDLIFVIMLVGTVILFFTCQTYRHAFPDSLKRRSEEAGGGFSARRLQSSIKRYVFLLFSVFAISQALLYLIEYQYLEQLTNQNFSVDTVARFLGIFIGILGLIELLTQLFTSSRLIERTGIFTSIALLPFALIAIGFAGGFASLPAISGPQSLFIGLIILKFLDEWLRYTIVASTRPVLFQPIPERGRARVQSLVGVVEALALGLTGAGILLVIALCNQLQFIDNHDQARIFLVVTMILAGAMLGVLYRLRSQYLNLLVLTADRGLLSFSEANLPALKQAIIEEFDNPGPEANKRSCIELLTHIDPSSISEVLAPALSDLSPALQRQSLETMLAYSKQQSHAGLAPDHSENNFNGYVEALIHRTQEPGILALALRYLWLANSEADITKIKPYLQPDIDPVVRGTAASILLRRGNAQERAKATYVLQQMLTHQRERERVMGCRALGEAEYMQGLRLHVPKLLQDDSLRVRRALLDAIAATQLEEFYPSLLQALRYKSTRESAVQALVKLGNEALPMLIKLAENPHQPDTLRHQAWQVIGRIGTLEALDILVANLITSWGISRRWILRILIKLSDEQGIHRSRDIDTALDRLGRKGVEALLNQELTFIGQLYGSLLDLAQTPNPNETLDWLQRALRDVQADAIERLFLLMRFLYPSSTIQAAETSLEGSATSRARGLEILDSTLDIPAKRSILTLLDRRSDAEKLDSLSALVNYRPLPPNHRLRNLVDLRHFLSDWSLACCFHVARAHHWRLTTDQVMACLRHPVGFVREAVLSYVELGSPRFLSELLPMMAHDPNPLVAEQVKLMMAGSLRSEGM